MEAEFWIVVFKLQIDFLFPDLRLLLSDISQFYDNLANLLVEIHIEYLDEIRLPAVVLGEGDGAGEPLHPGGVIGDLV